jgi:hypothetical protein
MALEVETYVPTDAFFGAPWIDEDVVVDEPVPHRQVHGGFEGTDTRFRFHFPLEGYEGRMINPLSGANGGTEDFFLSPLGEAIGGVSACLRLGAYMVQSNQGHIGDELDPKGGDDPTLYGWRASAEVARFSKHVAAQVYGEPPHHSYVFGGSGGGRRSPLCLENAPEVWDGALPFMADGVVEDFPTSSRHRSAQGVAFSCMFNVQRLLGNQVFAVADAMAPGGSGDPFAGLTTHQREELANLYRLGYPRGDEITIGMPLGQIWAWTSFADRLQDVDADYFRDFWGAPGFVGHDQPENVLPDLIDGVFEVSRVLTAQDVLDDPSYGGPQYLAIRGFAALMVQATGLAGGVPMVVEVKGVGDGYRLGAGVRITTGEAAGRQLYAMNVAGDLFLCDGMGEVSNQRFNGVRPGDQVHIDNHAFLAYCYYYRHHLMDDPQFDFLRVDGTPLFAQFPQIEHSPLMGVPYTGHYEGKLMWVHHTHDASLWHPAGIIYDAAVRRAQGEQGHRRSFRQRWTENAEHGPAAMVPSLPGRASSTWLIDYGPVIEQCLKDLIDWVEDGVEPVSTAWEYADGRVLLSPDADTRGGIQPVVRLTADGGSRAEVAVGRTVTFEVSAAVPSGAGTLVSLAWDLDGSGGFELVDDEVDGSQAALTRTLTHAFDRPGSYFVSVRVASHRDGDRASISRHIPNLAQVRVVVS